jgi:transposase
VMSRIEVLEAAHRPIASFYAPVILFQHVVFILAGAVVDIRAEFLGDGPGIAGVAVGGDLLGFDLGDRPGRAEERLGRGHVAGLAEENVDQVAVSVDRPVEIAPCAGDLDVGLILSANSRGALQREELSMSLHPDPICEIPAETARVAHAAFPKGTVAMRLREEFDTLYRDEDFQALYPNRGQPALAPWHLALITIFQFLEHLSDRQAADAVRARIDWKFALGLELTDPGFHFSVLTEFRSRLVTGQADHLLLDTMLERFKERGLVKARGRQRSDSTHVLGAVRDLHLLELVGETLRATLDDLAAVVPDWLRALAPPA